MITSETIFQALDQYCGAYLAGPKGTGKTLLSVVLTEELKNRRIDKQDQKSPLYSPWVGDRPAWRIFANFMYESNSDITPDLLDENGPGLHHAIIILDEVGSRYAGARSWGNAEQQKALGVVDYARKQRLYFITPSASAVDKKLRELEVFGNIQARWFFKSLGLNDVVWHYLARPLGNKPFGFFLWFPYAYYGLYDTNQIPGPYEDAVFLLIRKFQERYVFDAEKARLAAEKYEAELLAGRVVPGLRPSRARPSDGGSPAREAPSKVRPYSIPLWYAKMLNVLWSRPFYQRFFMFGVE